MTQTQSQTNPRPAGDPRPKDLREPPANCDDTLGPGPIPAVEYPPKIPNRKPDNDTISHNELYYRLLAETLDKILNLSPHEEKKC
jgi:hypothetical protein